MSRERDGFRLLDEHADPPVRDVIGRLMGRCETADLALTRIRLAALDLTEAEVHGPRHCRVLLGQLDAAALFDSGSGARPEAVVRLRGWLESGRLEVRSAGIGAWVPDFSVFTTPGSPPTILLGAHYFGSPQLAFGPSFTAVVQHPASARLLGSRFQALWERAHDVAPAIHDVLVRATRADLRP